MHWVMQYCVTENDIVAEKWADECYDASEGSIIEGDASLDNSEEGITIDGSYCLCSEDECNTSVEDLGGEPGSLGGAASQSAAVALLGACVLFTYTLI